MKKQFPCYDPIILGPMFNDITAAIAAHLGFAPENMVLIVTDGKKAQTMFAGQTPDRLTQLLVESTENHIKHGHGKGEA